MELNYKTQHLRIKSRGVRKNPEGNYANINCLVGVLKKDKKTKLEAFL
tara:strand:- start:241 stop:384 length:144 start_codon:yes stop_codon:yes gene_type:complete